MDTGTLVWTVVLSVLNDVLTFERILQTIAHLAYLIMSWILSIIDFLFILVRQLAGLNTDFSSFDSVIKSDAIFKFIFSEQVTTIMRNMVILAVVVILVLGIIAIIKNEYNSVRDESNSGDINNGKGLKEIWSNIFQSILLLFLIPMILFGGLILSNGLLQTLDNYTRGHTGNHSVGAKIFVASSYDANNFRHYAVQNKKIPITYQFNQVQDYTAITDWDTTGRADAIVDGIATLKRQPEWIQGLTTFTMFYSNLFYNMDTIDYLEINDSENNAYHDIYDVNIRTYKYEYYANADAIDYMIETGRELYYVTAKEAYDIAQSAGVQLNMSEKDGYLTFAVNYEDDLKPLDYKHPLNSTNPVTDESQGAVYLLCLKKTITDNAGNSFDYYQPLTNGQDNFVSYALDEGQYVVARGLFDDAKYPTAIRQVGGNVQFYREKLNIPTFSSFFPHISYELPDGVTEEPSTWLIRKGIEYFTGVDLADFMPYIYFDIDFMHLFGKSEDRVWTLSGKSFLQDYTFKSTTHGVFTEIFVLENKQMELTYYNLRINWIVLIIAGAITIGKMLWAMFGLMRRMVDIMVLYVMYPAAVATIPLKGKSSLESWTKQMFNKVTSMYGFIVGMNLGFLLLAPITSINLITPEMLSSNPAFAWMTNMFGISGMGAKVVNGIIQILFYLVGLIFIFEIPKIVQAAVQGIEPYKDNKPNKDVEDIVSQGGDVIKGTTEYYKKVGDIISGKKLMDDIKGLKDFVPGNAIVKDLKHKAHQAGMKAAFGRHADDAEVALRIADKFNPTKHGQLADHTADEAKRAAEGKTEHATKLGDMKEDITSKVGVTDTVSDGGKALGAAVEGGSKVVGETAERGGEIAGGAVKTAGKGGGETVKAATKVSGTTTEAATTTVATTGGAVATAGGAVTAGSTVVEGGGVVADATGVGAPAGAVANVAGGVGMAAGATATAAGSATAAVAEGGGLVAGEGQKIAGEIGGDLVEGGADVAGGAVDAGGKVVGETVENVGEAVGDAIKEGSEKIGEAMKDGKETMENIGEQGKDLLKGTEENPTKIEDTDAGNDVQEDAGEDFEDDGTEDEDTVDDNQQDNDAERNSETANNNNNNSNKSSGNKNKDSKQNRGKPKKRKSNTTHKQISINKPKDSSSAPAKPAGPTNEEIVDAAKRGAKAGAEHVEENKGDESEELMKNKRFMDSHVKTYADVDKAGYEKYRKEHNLEDNDAAKAKYYINQRNSGGNINPEQKKKFIANNNMAAMMGNQEFMDSHVRNYSNADKEGYKKYLKEHNLEDNDVAKAKYYTNQRDSGGNANPTQRKKFIENNDAAELMSNKAFMDSHVRNYADVDKEGYEKYRKEHNMKDDDAAKAKYYLNQRDSGGNINPEQKKKFIANNNAAASRGNKPADTETKKANDSNNKATAPKANKSNNATKSNETKKTENKSSGKK